MVDDAGGLDVLVASVLGDPVERKPRENDVVLLEFNGKQILGFVFMGKVIVRTPDGVIDLPLKMAKVAWEL